MDNIQRTSSIPLPDRITEQSFKDPLPLDSHEQIQESDDKRHEPAQNAKDDAFEDYLNQSSITHLEQNQKSASFDPVEELSKNGVYFDPGKSSPI